MEVAVGDGESSTPTLALPPPENATLGAAVTPSSVVEWALEDEKILVNRTMQHLEKYMHDVKAQHAHATLRMQQLANIALGSSLLDSLDALNEAASDLETLFGRIDEIERHMNQLNNIIREVHKAINTIDSKASVKEKTASLFHSIGFKAAASTAVAGLWARVPTHCMINQMTAPEYKASLRPTFDFFRVSPEQSDQALP